MGTTVIICVFSSVCSVIMSELPLVGETKGGGVDNPITHLSDKHGDRGGGVKTKVQRKSSGSLTRRLSRRKQRSKCYDR